MTMEFKGGRYEVEGEYVRFTIKKVDTLMEVIVFDKAEDKVAAYLLFTKDEYRQFRDLLIEGTNFLPSV